GTTASALAAGRGPRTAGRESGAGNMQIINPATVHPVIVIGSGASGGMAAWNLTQKGIDVLLLDAGDKFDRSTFWTHVRPWERRERRARGEKPPQFFLDPKEQPYTSDPVNSFTLIRVW